MGKMMYSNVQKTNVKGKELFDFSSGKFDVNDMTKNGSLII